MNRKILRVCAWNAGDRLAASLVIAGHLCQSRSAFGVHRIESLARERHIRAAPLGERAGANESNALQHDRVAGYIAKSGSLRVSESGFTLCHVERSETSLTLSESLMGY